MRLVLDAEAVDAPLEVNHPARRTLRRPLTSARRLGRRVCIPSVTVPSFTGESFAPVRWMRFGPGRSIS